MKIVLDTNFILSCMKKKIDFIELADELFDDRIEWLLLDSVEYELLGLSKRKGSKIKDRQAAKIGLKYLTGKVKVINLKEKGHVDDLIVDYCNKKDVLVASLDRDLKQRLDCKVLTISDDKSLKVVNG